MDKKSAVILSCGLAVCGLLIGAGIAAGMLLGKDSAQPKAAWYPNPETMTEKERQAVREAFTKLANSY